MNLLNAIPTESAGHEPTATRLRAEGVREREFAVVLRKNKIPCLRQLPTEGQGTFVQVPFGMDHELLDGRKDIDEPASASFVLKLNETLNLGKQGVIVSQANISPRFDFGPTLPNQD